MSRVRSLSSASQQDLRTYFAADPDDDEDGDWCPFCEEPMSECECDGPIEDEPDIPEDAILEAALEREDSEADCPDGFDGR